jgi:hypothetical protein
MRRHEQPCRPGLALITALALLAQPVAPAVARPRGDPGQTASQKPAQAAAPAAQTVADAGWPRLYQTASGSRFMIYQPQIADWTNQRHMSAYAAVSIEQPGAQKPALGTVKIEANTKVAVDVRMVSFSDMSLSESNFPTLQKEQVREVVDEIVKSIPVEDRVMALDRVLASIDMSQIKPNNVEGVKADPPPIFFSKTPAILVNIDGEPIWSPIKDNDLKFAVNTNWDLFQHTLTNAYYLLHQDSWLTTSDLKGAWVPAKKLPESFSKLPKDENWKETSAAVPGKKLDARKAPGVFVSTTPAEMILLSGEPSYLLVGNTQLLWVNNTESDVFRLGKTGSVYYLIAGRWFSAPDFTGPWTFATLKLPGDFQKIPLEHRGPASLRRCPARSRQPRPCCLRRCLKPRGSTRRKSRHRKSRTRAIRNSRQSRRRSSSMR